MRKKALVLLQVMTMGIVSLSGCTSSSKPESSQKVENGQKETTSNGTEKSTEVAIDAFSGTEITVALLRNALDKSDDYTKKTIVKMAEDATGIKVNFTGIDATTRDEKIAVMLADSKEMPDMMIGLVGAGDILSNKELFYDLSEKGLLETYAPNVYSDHINTVGIEVITQTDGSIRSLMTGGQSSIGSAIKGIPYINQKWLKQLNLNIPKTIDEFYKVLCAFRDNDMDGNGNASDEIPFVFANNLWCSTIYELAGFWGISGSSPYEIASKIEKGKVIPTLDKDNFKSYIQYINKLINENLIDKEGFSQTYEQFVAKLEDGKTGCFFGWTPHTYMDKDLSLDYKWMAPVKALEGVDPLLAGQRDSLIANRYGVVFNAKSKNVKAALWWWNYLSNSTENKWTANNGPIDKVWEWKKGEEGKTVLNRKMDESELPNGWNQANYSYSNGLTGGGIGPYIRTDELAFVDFTTDPTTDNSYRFAATDELWEYQPNEFMPIRNIDPEKSTEVDFIWLELEAYLKEFIATSMMDGLTDAAWDVHLEKLKTLQYYDWIEWQQNYYDGTL